MEEAREAAAACRYAAAAASEMPGLGLSIVLDRVAVTKRSESQSYLWSTKLTGPLGSSQCNGNNSFTSL